MIFILGVLAVLLPLVAGREVWRHYDREAVKLGIDPEQDLRYFLRQLGITIGVTLLLMYLAFQVVFLASGFEQGA